MADDDHSVDLTKESPTSKASPRIEAPPYDPYRDRERVRGWIALFLLMLLIAVVGIALFGVLFGKIPVEHLEKIGAIILSPVVGLLGAVMGFYFGEQSRNRHG